jgi:DNA-binding protein HU-beta
MTKEELIKKTSEAAGVSQKEVSKVLKAFIQCVRQEEKVQMIGFGTFKWKLRPAKTILHPTTRQPVKVPEKNVLTFKASKGV